MGRAAFGKTKTGKLKPHVRPQKHSAQTPKKPYSTHRTDQDTWIAIPVPPLVSEELFRTVQHQLDENRRRARIGSRGACYLLQGLTVCGHCHYAYYGKKISPSTAKGKRQYAYYRCIGTDAYRFGGERICDNMQVRTQRLDDVVWDQVRETIKNPARLKKEYEKRLTKMEDDTRGLIDTTALKGQRAHLKKGKSRLIDSYASGVIDKDEFEPKINNLKQKLAQIDEQIERSVNTESAQYELFLVIDRLEEFSKKVDITLGTMDFNAKREIIRALVKRVEIYREEVVVVFRIDPEAPANNKTGSTSPETGVPIMHNCNRRNHAALRCAAGRLDGLLSRLPHARFQPLVDQRQERFIVDSLGQHFHQPRVAHVIEKAFDVGFDDVAIPSELKIEHQAVNGLMGALVGAVAVTAPLEVRFPETLQYLADALLDEFVIQCRQSQRPLAAIAFRDIHSLDVGRSVLLVFELPV